MSKLLGDYPGPLELRLWDGTTLRFGTSSPGGLFLNHGITSREGGWRRTLSTDWRPFDARQSARPPAAETGGIAFLDGSAVRDDRESLMLSFAWRSSFAIVLACAGGAAHAQDRYDPAAMDLKPKPSKTVAERNKGPFAEGASLSPGAVLLPLDPSPVRSERTSRSRRAASRSQRCG